MAEKKRGAVFQLLRQQVGGNVAVCAYHLREKFLAQNGLSILLLLTNDLQEDTSRDVVARFSVDYLEFNALQDEIAYIRNCDVATFFRIV